MTVLEISFDSLHGILRSLYNEMMPLCEDMTGVSKGIAGLGALFYVAMRVWQSLSRGEPVDVYPLLRPFVVGFAIMFFPTFVLGTINGVMSPVVTGAHGIVASQTLDMERYRAEKDRLEDEAVRRSHAAALLVDDEGQERELRRMGILDLPQMAVMFKDSVMHQIKKKIREWFRELLELLFEAAALVIDTIRTFFLIVLSILGPLAFAI